MEHLEYSMTMEELQEELEKLKKMEELTPEIFKIQDSEFWILQGLRKLYEMAKSVDQLAIPEFDNSFYVPCKRVVKSKIGIPNYLIKKYNVECLVFMGFFVVVNGYLIHRDMVENFFAPLINSKKPPTKEELIDFEVPEDGRWDTAQTLNNGYGFILNRNPINDLFLSRTKYEYLDF